MENYIWNTIIKEPLDRLILKKAEIVNLIPVKFIISQDVTMSCESLASDEKKKY